jgi:hypothetical protein
MPGIIQEYMPRYRRIAFRMPAVSFHGENAFPRRGWTGQWSLFNSNECRKDGSTQGCDQDLIGKVIHFNAYPASGLPFPVTGSDPPFRTITGCAVNSTA